MKAIFHIGMGKTGTSSIQRVLESNAAALQQQKFRYLGMWPNFIHDDPQQKADMSTLVGLSDEEKVQAADRFFELCQKEHAENQAETFIFSNEAIFQHAGHLKSFFGRLKELMSISLVAYIRAPANWLPSAYTQWGLHHKTRPGPIRSFPELARESLMNQYRPVQIWNESFADEFIPRSYDDAPDVVADFSQVIGIELPTPKSRELVRGEQAQVLLRALYNNKFKGPVHPARFDNQIINTRRSTPESIDSMISKAFEYSELEEIISENKDVFEYMEAQFGFDLLSAKPKVRDVDHQEIRDRLVDYLIHIVFDLSERVHALENEKKESGEE